MTTGLIPEYSLLVTNLYAPPGTRIPMQQAVPPLGWISDASAPFTDCSMRINSGSGGSNGGSQGWSGWNFGGTFSLNAFTIAIGNLPAHNHGISDPGHGHGISDPTHNHSANPHNHSSPSGFAFWTATPTGGGVFTPSGGIDNINLENGTSNATVGLNAAATGISVNSATSNISTTNTGSGVALVPNYTTPQVKYADHIIAVKS